MPKKPPKKEVNGATPFVPDTRDLEELADAAKECRGCELWKNATQTVFGEGGRRAQVMLVGEQPGDKEDLQGHPFVGPAGRLLDEALEAAGIPRSLVYVTNAVKHFRFEMVGKRRIHQKPGVTHVRACHPWLESEIRAIRPKVIVLMGATAAQALLGKDFKVTQQRGELLPSGFADQVMATVHPSSILRAPDEEKRHEEKRRFIEDLKRIARLLT